MGKFKKGSMIRFIMRVFKKEGERIGEKMSYGTRHSYLRRRKLLRRWTFPRRLA
jgi:hypothetical protein